MSSHTLEGVQQRIVEELGELVRLIPAGKGKLPSVSTPRTTV
jgi:hypothetical protein